MKRKKLGICPICGLEKELTRDHVPPRCLFPAPLRNPMIVFTCASCNNGTNNNDEEFGVILNMLANSRKPLDTSEYWDRAFRTLKNQGALRKALLATTVPVLLTTESGIVYGNGAAFSWSPNRLLPTVEKIAKLLHFHHLERPIDHDATVSTVYFDSYGQPEGEELERRSSLLSLAQECRREVSERPDCFSYRWAVAQDDPRHSIWILVFMERVVFLTIVGPEVDHHLPTTGPANADLPTSAASTT